MTGAVGPVTSANSEGVRLSELITRSTVPVFVNVTLRAELVVVTVCEPKSIEPGVAESMGVAGETPVPVRETLVGELGSLLVNVNWPVNVCSVAGVKVTL